MKKFIDKLIGYIENLKSIIYKYNKLIITSLLYFILKEACPTYNV